MKQYMKEMADERNRASQYEELNVGGTVLVKRDGTPSKLQTSYIPKPLVIQEKKGTMVTASSEDKQVTRNESMFKKVPSDISSESDTPTTDKPQDEDHGPRRSTRVRKEPEFVKDFVKCVTYV